MGKLISTTLTRALLALLIIVALGPILWTVLGAFKELRDIVTPVPKLIFEPTLDNFATILRNPTIRDGLLHSVIVVSASVLVGAVLGIPAAHTLARHARRWGDDVQFFVLSLRFMPPVAIAIPFIVIYLDLGIYDTLFGLILVYLITTISTVIWLAVPAFERVPHDIEEAAAMEGCGPAEVFWRFSLPLAAPSLFGALVFTFVLVWNELLLALTLAAQNATLPVVAASITSLGKEVPWGVINAATVLLVLPPLVFIGLLMGLLNTMVRSGPKQDTSMAHIHCTDIVKSYGAHPVISGLNLDIPNHEFVVFLGPSGCGKSTMLRMIAGLEEVSGGRIEIGGTDVTDLPPGERGVAMVFQSYALYPHMSVADNITFGLRRQGVSKAEIAPRLKQVAEVLGLEQFLDRRPKNLSGGQQQRVAMARAMIKTPKVFLFDEPLSNLDAKLREKLRTEIRRMHLKLKTTTIFVTHDQLEAMTIADRIVLMRDGMIEQMGTPDEIFERPASRFVADFIGTPAMNFVTATLEAGLIARSGSIKLQLSEAEFPSLNLGQEVELGLRPARMDLCAPGSANALTGEVVLVENMGAEGQVITEVDGAEISFVTQGFRDLSIGDTVHFTIRPEHIHVFDPKTGRSLRKD